MSFVNNCSSDDHRFLTVLLSVPPIFDFQEEISIGRGAVVAARPQRHQFQSFFATGMQAALALASAARVIPAPGFGNTPWLRRLRQSVCESTSSDTHVRTQRYRSFISIVRCYCGRSLNFTSLFITFHFEDNGMS